MKIQTWQGYLTIIVGIVLMLIIIKQEVESNTINGVILIMGVWLVVEISTYVDKSFRDDTIKKKNDKPETAAL